MSGLIYVDVCVYLQVTEQIWICENETITPWDGDIYKYKQKLVKIVKKENEKQMKNWCRFLFRISNWTSRNIYLLKNVCCMKSCFNPCDSPMGESFQDYSWIQDFEADFP